VSCNWCKVDGLKLHPLVITPKGKRTKTIRLCKPCLQRFFINAIGNSILLIRREAEEKNV
jgi:hypothetical protein